MASITIRNLNEDIKRRLQVRASQHGRSLEAEVRDILRQAVTQASAPLNLGKAIQARFLGFGGVELPPSQRDPMRRDGHRLTRDNA